MTEINLLGIPIQNITMQQAVGQIQNAIHSNHSSSFFFVNAHCINVARNDEEYRMILQQNQYNYADGTGMTLAAKCFGIHMVDNVNGTDMFPLLCRELHISGTSMYLLGATPDRLEALIKNINTQYPTLQIAGHHHGYFDWNDNPQIIDDIRKSKPDVLLVAMGVPIQEKWIHKHAKQLGVPAILGVGGLFDFYSGAIPRAPVWMRRIGMEWLFRLYQEPARLWKRYLIGNITFLTEVIYKRLIYYHTD